jgi:hypothetical protein
LKRLPRAQDGCAIVRKSSDVNNHEEATAH